MNIATTARRVAAVVVLALAGQAQAGVVGLGSIADRWFDPERAGTDVADIDGTGPWTRWHANGHDLADVPPLTPDFFSNAAELAGIGPGLADRLGFSTGGHAFGDAPQFERGHHRGPPRQALDVPEPGSVPLVACSLALLALARRRRR